MNSPRHQQGADGLFAQAGDARYMIGPEDTILVTGAGGFIGSKVVERLLSLGFNKVRGLARSSVTRLDALATNNIQAERLEVLQGNLLSQDDCKRAVRGAKVIYHLAAEGGKSFPGAFMNCVVTTRNLLKAAAEEGCLLRFVNTGSFAVYSNYSRPRRKVLDESCPVEDQPVLRGDAYCYAKLKQDEIVMEYYKRHKVPYVIVRPGVVYGPGKQRIHGRVGLDTFGIFLHLGGSNRIPFTYVDNCADAIVLAGLTPGIEGEVFNVVDDDLPSSRQFLRMYKRRVRNFRSIYLPPVASYIFCLIWEKYSAWSQGQLPPVHNRRSWAAYWKRIEYSNKKLKERLGWFPKVSTAEGMNQFLAGRSNTSAHA